MIDPLRVLLVEDSPTDAKLVLQALRGIGRSLTHKRVQTAKGMRDALRDEPFDIILSDWSMPSFDAQGALAIARELSVDLPFIIVSGTIGETTVVDALRDGAHDYVFKDQLGRLVPTVERELRERQARKTARDVQLALERAEAETRAEQARFRALVENGSDGVVLTTEDGAFLYVSPAAARILGRTAEQARGMTPRDFTHPDDLAAAAEQRRTLLETGHAPTALRRVVRADGSIRWVEVTATNFLHDPAIGAIVTNVRDVTERRLAESALVVAERRFTALFESGIIGIIISDAAGTARTANDTFLAMLGYTRDDLDAGRIDWTRSTPPEWQGWHATVREELERYGSSKPREKEYFRKDGSRVSVLVGATRMDDGSVVAIAIDLTDRKRAEATVLTEQTRFRALVENGADGITINTDEATFAYVSPAAARIFGEPADALVGRRIVDFVDADDRATTMETMRRVRLAAGAIETLVHRVRRADASIRWVETTRTNRLHDPAVRGVVCNIRDITDRKTAEEALVEAEQAKANLETQLRHSQKMEAVGRLAGGVAHDFNNVLSVIMSYGEFLLEQLGPEDAMRADVEEIRKAAKRAASLTRQLLMFSRQQVIEPRMVDLNDLLENMDKMLQRILGEDVELVAKTAKKLGTVLVDPSGIEQVVMNLVVNARDAMPTGGKLTIETANVSLDEAFTRTHIGAIPGPYVMLAVTDTGSGMDRSTQAQIFEPFFTTKETGKGTGLGLSMVFGIVKQSGGTVWVYSEVGRGTTFKIYLPRLAGNAGATETVVPRTTLRGGETILLVEDEEQVRQIARMILTRNGYTVLEASNAADALRLCESHEGTIHMLLSDVVMPQVSGPELAKRLAALRPEMRVLCMSGYTDDSIVRHGVMEAHFAFLQKPFTAASLTRRVREVLDAS